MKTSVTFFIGAAAVLAAAFSPLLAAAQAGEPPSIATHHDTIPNPCHASVYGPGTPITATADGDWTAAGTWSLGRAPAAGDIVFIPAGRNVRINDATAQAKNLCIHGTLRFAESVNTKLVVGTAFVFSDGTLQVGTSAIPISADRSAEIVFQDTALNTAVDPTQILSGLISLGKVRIHGAPIAATWIRLAAEPQAASDLLSLSAAPAGWRVGDRIIIPGSHQERTESSGVPNTYKFEERIIERIDASTVELTQPLTYSHPGARNLNGQIEFLPHAGNLTRNVILRSQTPQETGKAGFCTGADKLTSPGSCITRAHTLFTSRADIDVRYAAFRDLGRTLIDPLNSTTFSNGVPASIGTNQIGRYPIHAHHLFGPTGLPESTPQFTFLGNAVDGGSSTHRFKWGTAIHGSHYGRYAWNVIYNMGGAGLMTEDGSESYNTIEYNFVVRTLGDGGRETGTNATEGVGYYFRGGNNYVRHNVTANQIETNGVEAAFGLKYNFVYLGTVRIPNFKGADTQVAGQYTERDGNSMPILENIGTEIYGNIQGVSLWWICTLDTAKLDCDQNVAVPSGRSIIKDMKLWHISRYSFYGYPQNKVTFDGLVVRGDPTLIASDCCEFGGLLWWGDYATYDLVLRNLNVQGIRSFVLPYFAGGTTEVVDSFFQVKHGLSIQISHAPGSCPGCTHPARRQILRNVRYAALPGRNVSTVSLSDQREGAADVVSLNETFVCDHNGVTTDDFQLLFIEQNSSFTIPGTSGGTVGCPGGTMTNQQCWTNHQKAYAGFITPCTAERPASAGMRGYVCSTAQVATVCGSAPPDGIAPGAPQNLRQP